MFPNGKMVTLVRRTVTGTDDFNNDIYSSTTEEAGPCSVQPSTSRESLGFAEQLITGIVVFLPYGTNVNYLDAVIVDGVQYEINGAPDTWASPFTGSVAPIRIEGTIVEGASP